MPPKNKAFQSAESEVHLADIEAIIKDTLKSPVVLDELAKSLASIVIKKYELKQKEMAEKIEALEDKLRHKEKEISDLNTRVQDMEQYSRRNSLRIFGLVEESNEQTEKVVTCFLNNKLNVSLTESCIDRVHRVGKPSSGKIRPIILKLTNYHDRDSIFKVKSRLKGSGVVVREDLTAYNLSLLTKVINKYGLRNAWSRDGKIFYKSRDKIFKVRCDNDI